MISRNVPWLGFWVLGGRAASVAAASGLVLVAALALAPDTLARSAPDSFADLAERLSPSVVIVTTTQQVRGRGPSNRPDIPQFPPGSPFEEYFRDFFDRQRPDGEAPRRRPNSVGSGFIIDASGIVVTNNHVIADSETIEVVLYDNRRAKAVVIGRDERTDLAVLKIEVEGPLPFVTWGDSSIARVGDWVMAIGSSLGLRGTVTAGIISARNRDINAGPYDDFIQTDASINRGNSGGPLFNMDGEVIGINTAIFSPTGGSVGVGFAIPSAMAMPVVSQLSATGTVRRGWLGVRIQTVDEDIAEGLGLEAAEGALVASVNEGEPAYGHIEPGDVILKFDGTTITDTRTLTRAVAGTEVGRTVEVEVWRKGRIETVSVAIGELRDERQAAALAGSEPESAEILGLALAELTPDLRSRFGIEEDAKGVVVVGVDQESSAAEGIQAGDVITEVSQNEVTSPAEIVERVREVQDSGRKSVVFTLSRGGDLSFVAVRLGSG